MSFTIGQEDNVKMRRERYMRHQKRVIKNDADEAAYASERMLQNGDDFSYNFYYRLLSRFRKGKKYKPKPSFNPAEYNIFSYISFWVALIGFVIIVGDTGFLLFYEPYNPEAFYVIVLIYEMILGLLLNAIWIIMVPAGMISQRKIYTKISIILKIINMDLLATVSLYYISPESILLWHVVMIIVTIVVLAIRASIIKALKRYREE